MGSGATAGPETEQTGEETAFKKKGIQEYHSRTPDDSVQQNVNTQLTLYVSPTYTLCDVEDIIRRAVVMVSPPLTHTCFPPPGCLWFFPVILRMAYTQFPLLNERTEPQMLGDGMEKEGMLSRLSRLTRSIGYFKIGPKIPHPNPNCRLLLFLVRRKASNPLKPVNC